VVLIAGVSACTSDASKSGATSWTERNKTLKGYELAADAQAKQVTDQIVAKGVPCGQYSNYSFGLVLAGYNGGNLPMARGAGTCYAPTNPADPTSDKEEVLVEVFGKRPSAKDFVTAKAKYICKRAEKLQQKGADKFGGIPFVMSKNATYIIEPDSSQMAKRIATALGLTAQDMCNFD